MSSIALSLLALGCILAGILLGGLLPGDKLSSEAKEVIRLSTGLIGTIAALVLGLLIASAKSSYDTQSGQIRQLTANIVLLDLLLSQYGPEAADARQALRKNTNLMASQIWNPSARAAGRPFKVNAEGLELYQRTQALQPVTEGQRNLQTRAVQLITETAQARLLLFTQAQEPIPMPFLAILIFWLTMIFASFSLFARPGPLVIGTLALFALSATGAIYLILELGQPFTGLLKIPNAPMAHALEALPR
ncbi:MAG: DUF4239 domain-containing protein [Pseudorhodoplanes sp.]|uniref:bestrophin-like domain n=1 Tax=Pseudorhodoplanes sp. TaxID=1934341 RepID=UPI003D0B6C2D